MHLSPAAIQSAIRLLDQPATAIGFGDILETGSTAIEKGEWVEPVKLVSRIFASWNQLGGWLRQVDDLKRVA